MSSYIWLRNFFFYAQLNEDLCYHMKQKSCSGFYCRGHKKNLLKNKKKSNDGKLCVYTCSMPCTEPS